MNQGYLQQLLDFPNQIEEAATLGKDIPVKGPVASIVLSGMGGSAGPGEFLQSYIDFPIPFTINREYDIPATVSSKTLFIAISYSGNTEESVSALKAARRKGAQLIVIAAGGKLAQMAKDWSVPFIKVPSGMQPRAGLAYLFFPLLNILHSAGIIKDPSAAVQETIKAIKKADVTGQAKQLAEKLVDKVPLIYASHNLRAVAHKWKINFNENSKTHAFFNEFPELNHNEMVGFTRLAASYHVIMLEDEADHRRVKERMKITKQLISEKGIDVTYIALSGTDLLSRMFSAVHLGSLTSFYLAENYGIDPEPVVMVEGLKKELGPFSG